MHIHTTARHFELDPELRRFTEERLERFERFARDIQEVHVVLTAEGRGLSAEIALKLKRHEMVSRQQSTEPRWAIDRAADRIEHQLRKLKGKRVSRKRERLVARIAPIAPENGAANGADEPESGRD